MERGGGRKKSGGREESAHVQAAKEEILPGYEEYLVLLQERNRLLKRLRKKNKNQIDQERREQGFSLYVNGPHKDGKHSVAGNTANNKPTIPTQPKTDRKPKTAGEYPRGNQVLDNHALEEIAREEMERQKDQTRAQTAPNRRERRGNWNVESMEIKTTQGGKKIKAPEFLSGKYADDFESGEESDELRSSGSEQTDYVARKPLRKPPPPRESDMFNSSDSICSEDELQEGDSDEELEIDASKYSKNSTNKSVRKSTSKHARQSNRDVDDGGSGNTEKLMLSLKELKTLRHSLVHNAAIRDSMARMSNASEDDYEPESPIPEVEEDLPTDDSTCMDDSHHSNDDNHRNINLKQPSMKPNDTIVLEFGGGPPSNKKAGRNLSAARRKDLDEGEYNAGPSYQRSISNNEKQQGKGLPNPMNRSQSANILGSDGNAGKKSVRPLSANRRTPDRMNTDPDNEASAVMAALRAENEQASKLKTTPRAKPRSTQGSRENVARLQYDQSELPPRSHQMRSSDSSSTSSSQFEPLVPADKIEQIMERVLKMSPKHQRRLVSMLGKIEKSVLTESVDKSIANPRSSKPGVSRDGPVRAVHTSVNKSLYSNTSDEDIIDIHIEVTSNWGHNMRLGLTEIQLYDQTGSLVPVSPDDVSVHGAEECKGSVSLIFNGKFKTNKERNMWSCRYHARRPVEFIIHARNPNPKCTDKFSLSQMKIWNYNKSITELDIGVKAVRVFVGSDLVYTGAVEKGCGNQVFDYGYVIPLQAKNEGDLNPEIEVEKSDSPEVPVKSKNTPQVRAANVDKRQRRRETNESKVKQSVNQSRSRDSVELSVDKSHRRPPVSPKGERSPSPAPRLPAKSPREGVSVNHRSISPRPSQGQKKTFRSMSSQSSASSGGDSQPNSRPNSGVVTPTERAVRSETRTLNHSAVGRGNQGSDSMSENEDYSRDGPERGSQPAKRRGSKTPKKSKRMAARLDGHSSTEVDSSKSVSESSESRPPIPHRKSEEKLSRKALVQKSLEDKDRKTTRKETGMDAGRHDKAESETELDETLTAGTATVSSSVSVASSQDDTPMLQKLKDMNKKEQSSSRKKDVPRWLKQEEMAAKSETSTVESNSKVVKQDQLLKAPPSKSKVPPSPRSRTPTKPETPATKSKAPPSKSNKPPTPRSRTPTKPTTPPTQEEINMLIDEEMSLFPEQKKSADLPEPTMGDPSGDRSTPMQRIQQNRSRWRENPSMNLEESWGSLSQFNKCQRGRISLDMDDDVLDEYINKAAKLAGLPTEPAIPEEEGQIPSEQCPSTSMDLDDDTFVIPELPHGRELAINIQSTWGDKHYVGLTGIEAFSATGEQVNITRIHADPCDINILPEYNKDPRVVKNLVDGVNRTRDDIHMWLAPFTQGTDHWVYCTFDQACDIALIRIWNYNKSRIHSYRGSKDVVIMLDSTVIFKGEIQRACGGIEGGTEAFGDTILFTMDEAILEHVSQNDEAYEVEMLSDDEPFDIERPSTADEGDEKGRPFTRAVGNINKMERELTVEYEGDILVYKGKYVELNFTATWGDHHYLGLTGIEIVGKDGEALPVNMNMVTANPPDVRTLPGHERDDRTLDKVIDGVNVTMSDEHMWLVPFTNGQSHSLIIEFEEKMMMAGLRIWNYNKSKEDTYRGARIVHVMIDDKVVSPPDGFLIRKGLGTCHFDFAQEISFSPQHWNTSPGLSALGQNSGAEESDNYEVVQMPCGFIYQLQLFSTWGDAYYVGLNGIELYDSNLQKITLTESNISAYPDSVNVLEKIQNDVRTPDKLIDSCNDTMDGGHMWLAPILPNILNRVYVIFDQPTAISMIKIWNYSKTANRGAKDFALLVDDLLVYNGVLEALPGTARGILPNCAGPQPYHTILFTNNKDILRKEKNTVINHTTGEQDVQMTNDKKIVSHYTDPKKAKAGKTVDQNLRPTTSVIHSKKRR